jgi:Protein of unknown function (DUF3105)
LRIRHPGAWIGAAIFVVALSLVVVVVRPFDSSSKHSRNHPEYPAEYRVRVFVDETPAFGSGVSRHLQPGETVSYNSNPPTNGKHGRIAPWGISATPVPPEEAVHNMEHGGVVIWYNCDGGPQPLGEQACDQLLDDLSGLVGSRVDDGMYIVLTPYSEMENRIALTAWQNLDDFDEFDAARIEAFIASFECKFDPEGACRL